MVRLFVTIFGLLLIAVSTYGQRRIIAVSDPSADIYNTARAATYVNSYRDSMGDSLTVRIISTRPDYYSIFDTTDLTGRLVRYIGVVDSYAIGNTAFICPDSLGRGRIGVVDISATGNTAVKYVDITGFPADREFMRYFSDDIERLKGYGDRPFARLKTSVSAAQSMFSPGAFNGIFHKFQMDVSGADISLFSPASYVSAVEQGDITLNTLRDVLKYPSELITVRLRGDTLIMLLEQIAAVRFNRMYNAQSDMLNLRTAAWRHISVCGINYIIDAAKVAGRKITAVTMPDGKPMDISKSYTVVMTDFLARKLMPEGYDLSDSGDYLYLLTQWFKDRKIVIPEINEAWKIVPERWRQAAETRGIGDR